MSCDRYARMIIKTGQGLPTIPVSADHRNGDWIDTDIYEGEQYQDTDTGLVYTRWFTDIVLVGSSSNISTQHLLVSQTSTNAPTATQFEDNIGGGTWAYIGVGSYTLTNVGAFPSGKTSLIVNNGIKNGWIRAYRASDDVITVLTFNTSFVASDGVLDQTALIIKVIP